MDGAARSGPASGRGARQEGRIAPGTPGPALLIASACAPSTGSRTVALEALRVLETRSVTLRPAPALVSAC
jgi:hypothetical protein